LMLHKIRGGSSETEENELTVKPISPRRLHLAVIIATPVAKLPRLFLNSIGLKLMIYPEKNMFLWSVNKGTIMPSGMVM